MTEITSGAVYAFYLFDVAQGIDLAALRGTLGAGATVAQLSDKAPGPPRLRYVQPPVVIDGHRVGIDAIDGFRVRIKCYDYGVISLMLSRPFNGSWADLVRLGQDFIESEPLETHASQACQGFIEGVRSALAEPRASFLTEDYLAFVVSSTSDASSADAMVERHGADIAQLLRGERQRLSTQEKDEVLRHRMSYLADDLVVPAWNAAFVYDTEAGAAATLELLELVNSQLLEFRYHDDLLETELTQIYATLQKPRAADRFVGRRFRRATRHLHSLFIDVNELTDRMENAVKLVGDVYAARLFVMAAARLGLDGWKRNVEEKLKTLDDIYRFAVEQTGMSQANLMELAIVLICVIELGLLLAGLTK